MQVHVKISKYMNTLTGCTTLSVKLHGEFTQAQRSTSAPKQLGKPIARLATSSTRPPLYKPDSLDIYNEQTNYQATTKTTKGF